MNNNTILSWDDTDYKAIYTRQIKVNPIYWNDEVNAWVVYSYAFCKAILLNDDAQIPGVLIDGALNDKAKILIKNLARLSNNQQHDNARQAAMVLFESMRSVSVAEVLSTLLSNQKTENEFDWVAAVAKKLPVLIILKGLGFEADDRAFVTENIASLVKIMSPVKTNNDIIIINNVVSEFYSIAERHIKSAKFPAGFSNTTDLFVCNLIGLFIQSYDAGRGLLTNALVSMVNHHQMQKLDLDDIRKNVAETLRLDPPVHSTRRVAVKDIFIGNKTIRSGDAISIIMAAANLDGAVFSDPPVYNIERINNDQNLTFGLGGHNCIAKYFSTDLAMQTCNYLVNNYSTINIVQKDFNYEPQLNVRLVKTLIISLI
jgi:cytochrome P450